MITLNAPDGTVVADVSTQVTELVQWMVEQPDRPQFRFRQGKHLGTLTLKKECDVDRVKDFLYADENIGG